VNLGGGEEKGQRGPSRREHTVERKGTSGKGGARQTREFGGGKIRVLLSLALLSSRGRLEGWDAKK